jgi:hypothetical protein
MKIYSYTYEGDATENIVLVVMAEDKYAAVNKMLENIRASHRYNPELKAAMHVNVQHLARFALVEHDEFFSMRVPVK